MTPLELQTSSAYYILYYKGRLSSCLSKTPKATTVSHLANPDILSDDSIAFHEPRPKSDDSYEDGDATSMYTAPRREHDGRGVDRERRRV